MLPNNGAHAGRRKRASVLIASIVLVVSAGVATVSWATYVSFVQRAASRDRDRTVAFYTAESGVEAVVDYFNNPANFTGAEPTDYDTEKTHPAAYATAAVSAPLTGYKLFQPYNVQLARDSSGVPIQDKDKNYVVTRWSYFANEGAGTHKAVSLTSKIPTCELDISKNSNLVIRHPNGQEQAKVEKIELIHPSDFATKGGEPNPWNQRIICKVIATGRTPSGVGVRVESIMTENPNFLLAAPAAIITDATVDFNGHLNVFWGEIWAKEDVILPNSWESKIPRTPTNASTPFVQSNTNPEDAWFKLRTERFVLSPKSDPSKNLLEYADGSIEAGFQTTAPTSGTKRWTTPFDQATRYQSTKPKKDPWIGLGNVEQNQTLEFPKYSYTDWKTFVQTSGLRYLVSYNDGKLYGVEDNPSSANFGKMVGKSYDDWFGTTTSASDYAEPQKMIAFVDTMPTDSKGNVAPLSNGAPLIDDVYFPRDPTTDAAARMATIKLAGGSLHTRGAIFLAANMDMTGQGNPPSWNTIPESIGGVKMPNGQNPPNGTDMKIFHYGLLYVWGEVAGGGNRTVYGSIYARNGYAGSGNPTVFYNERLRDGSWFNLNTSRVSRRLWNVAEAKAGK